MTNENDHCNQRGHDNYIVTMVCNQVLRIIEGSYTCIYYSIINFGSKHCGSSLHLNIINDVSSAILDIDTVSSFTCLFDGFYQVISGLCLFVLC